MTTRTIGSLTEQDLRRAFDSGSMTRGKPYAHAGRVTLRRLDSDGLTARADVRGSGAESYSTTVQVRETRAGDAQIIATCTCPVGYNCKHAVALIVAVRDSIEPLDAPLIPQPRSSVLPRSEPPWKATLGALAGALNSRSSTEWALQFELYGSGRYGARMLTARPMRRGARGGWIKSGATWGDAVASATQRGPDAQSAALRDLYVASSPSTYGYRPPDAGIELAGLTIEMWRAFDRIVKSGVTLLGPGGATVTIEPEPITVGLGIRVDDSGDLQVTPTLTDTVMASHWDEGHSAVFGQPAHGMVGWDDDTPAIVRLARFDEPIDDTLRMMLATRRPVRVPQADTAEFLRDYFPRIQRALRHVEVDPRIDVPQIAAPRLAVTVTYDGLSADLRWGYAYDIDDRAVHVGLVAGREPFRDRTVERELVDAFTPPDTAVALTTTDSAGHAQLVPRLQVADYQTVILHRDVVPALVEAGVEVRVEGQQPDFRPAEAEPVVHLALDEGEAGPRDWFDLAVTVTIDDEPVAFEPLFAALTAGETHLVLPSGTYLSIDRPELVRLRELILEARELTDRRSGQLRVTRYHAGLWDELVQLGVVERQADSWHATIGSLARIEQIPVPEVPSGLNATLRPYQHDGYAWLSFLADHGLGGILADDMGLGKTVQALAMMVRQTDRGEGPFLVVAPTSVVANWLREAERFAPGLRVAAISQTRRRRGTELADAIDGADIVVTSYALFRIENDAYSERTWAGLFLDEAQFVKNHQGKTYACARRLDARVKIAITGTPLENSLMDLWAMLSIVAPGLYPDPKRFVEHYRKPIESGRGAERLALLQRRIRPLMRRRTKDEVASDLPAKTEQVLEVALSPRHARIYQTHLQRERQKVLGLLADDEDGNRFEVLRSLTRLRQLSLDPGLVDADYNDIGSAKIDVLMEHLAEVTAEGHRVLVFSQFTAFLKRVRARLDAVSMPYAYLDGRTRRRTEQIASFTSGDKAVFLISLKAGGFGLNLTEADYCYVLDPWWNPATEAQAVDRAHRIGQTRPVMVYRLVSAETIEEKVMELKARKAELFSAVMDDGAALSAALSADDIRGLLGA